MHLKRFMFYVSSYIFCSALALALFLSSSISLGLEHLIEMFLITSIKWMRECDRRKSVLNLVIFESMHDRWLAMCMIITYHLH